MEQELTPKQIVEKDFKQSMRGYNPEEVDEFLDVIIRDYDAFITEINYLTEENQKLNNEINRLKERNRGVENQTETESFDSGIERRKTNEQQARVSNFDMLKRISNLEREVFGSKLNEENN